MIKKRMIYQIYLGPHKKLYDYCTQSVARYCKKYGFDHIVQREPILKILPDLSRSPRSHNSWARLGYLPVYEKENAFSYLDKYDQIAIIDSDIYVREDAPNLFDELTPGTEFAGVIERDMPLTQEYMHKVRTYGQEQFTRYPTLNWDITQNGHNYMNMGLMVFDCKAMSTKMMQGQTPLEFLNRSEYKDCIDGMGFHRWSEDQVLMNLALRYSNIKHKGINWRWNALYKGIEDFYLRDSYFVHFFLKDHLPEAGENIEEIITLQGLR